MLTPVRVEGYVRPETPDHSPQSLLLEWNNQERYAVPYIELRYLCPCAGCVDEHTGERTVKRGTLKPDVKPTQVRPVGRYALQISWTDRHDTGMYHFDRLYEICLKHGTAV